MSERKMSVAAINAAKTQCNAGHHFAKQNAKGWRICLICSARRNREYRARQAVKGASPPHSSAEPQRP